MFPKILAQENAGTVLLGPSVREKKKSIFVKVVVVVFKLVLPPTYASGVVLAHEPSVWHLCSLVTFSQLSQ